MECFCELFNHMWRVGGSRGIGVISVASIVAKRDPPFKDGESLNGRLTFWGIWVVPVAVFFPNLASFVMNADFLALILRNLTRTFESSALSGRYGRRSLGVILFGSPTRAMLYNMNLFSHRCLLA